MEKGVKVRARAVIGLRCGVGVVEREQQIRSFLVYFWFSSSTG